MPTTIDWSNKIIDVDASILDLPAFHATLRGMEGSATGMLYPTTHTWKALDLGGGAYFYQMDLINGYSLRFANAGNYTIKGNLNGQILPVPGVYVERQTSAAYVTTAVGGSGYSLEQIAEAVLAAAQANPIWADARKMNGATILGDGTAGNLWRGG